MTSTLKPISADNLPEMYLNGRWRPSLTVTGIDDIPPTSKAGNVIWKQTTVKLSLWLPPTFDSDKAAEILKEKMLGTPAPYGAKVSIDNISKGTGFCAKPMTTKLKESLDRANSNFFGENWTCNSFGIGFSIPFLATLG